MKNKHIFMTIGILTSLIAIGSLTALRSYNLEKTYTEIIEAEPDIKPCRILIEQSAGQQLSCHAINNYVGLKSKEDASGKSKLEVYDRKSLNYLFQIEKNGNQFKKIFIPHTKTSERSFSK